MIKLALHTLTSIPEPEDIKAPLSQVRSKNKLKLYGAYILAQLHAADMSAENIVKATTYLTDRVHREYNRDVRQQILKGHTFALTVVLAGMFEERWLLKIDAIAEK